MVSIKVGKRVSKSGKTYTAMWAEDENGKCLGVLAIDRYTICRIANVTPRELDDCEVTFKVTKI